MDDERSLGTGIRAVKLEELERRLRNDVMHESMQWEGQVLLHRCGSPAACLKSQHVVQSKLYMHGPCCRLPGDRQ